MRRAVTLAGTAAVTAWSFRAGARLADPTHPWARHARRVGHVALGRPLIYGVTFRDTVAVAAADRLLVDSCTITGAATGIRLAP